MFGSTIEESKNLGDLSTSVLGKITDLGLGTYFWCEYMMVLHCGTRHQDLYKMNTPPRLIFPLFISECIHSVARFKEFSWSLQNIGMIQKKTTL